MAAYCCAVLAGEEVEPLGKFISRLVIRAVVVRPLVEAAMTGRFPTHEESKVKSLAREHRYTCRRSRLRYYPRPIGPRCPPATPA